MSFTEQTDGSGVAAYIVGISHPSHEFLTLQGRLTSGWATGDIDPSEAEQILSDLTNALEPLGYTFYIARERTAVDSWAEDPE